MPHEPASPAVAFEPHLLSAGKLSRWTGANQSGLQLDAPELSYMVKDAENAAPTAIRLFMTQQSAINPDLCLVNLMNLVHYV